MDKPAQNIQDAFLNNARKEKIVITIYLMSGVKLSGRIKSFDKYSLVLETNNQEQLIFKHAVSTVVTLKSVPFVQRGQPRGAEPEPPRAPARRRSRKPRRHEIPVLAEYRARARDPGRARLESGVAASGRSSLSSEESLAGAGGTRCERRRRSDGACHADSRPQWKPPP